MTAMDIKQISCSGCSGWEKLSVDVLHPEEMNSGTEMSGFYCKSCGTHLTMEAEMEMKFNEVVECVCGTLLGSYTAPLRVKPDSVPVLRDKEAVKTTIWYHATNIPDWLAKVSAGEDRPYVHVGTYDAAAELAAGRYWPNGENGATGDVFLWEVMVNPEAVISDDIVQDENQWCETVQSCSREHLGGDVQRYLNRWEGTGAISLLIDPKMLTEVKLTKLKAEDCARFIQKEVVSV